jgi:hypothetical protein
MPTILFFFGPITEQTAENSGKPMAFVISGGLDNVHASKLVYPANFLLHVCAEMTLFAADSNCLVIHRPLRFHVSSTKTIVKSEQNQRRFDRSIVSLSNAKVDPGDISKNDQTASYAEFFFDLGCNC